MDVRLQFLSYFVPLFIGHQRNLGFCFQCRTIQWGIRISKTLCNDEYLALKNGHWA